jgi:hypothetical protein
MSPERARSVEAGDGRVEHATVASPLASTKSSHASWDGAQVELDLEQLRHQDQSDLGHSKSWEHEGHV